VTSSLKTSIFTLPDEVQESDYVKTLYKNQHDQNHNSILPYNDPVQE